MRFTQTPLMGAYTVDLEPRGDERGFFARFYCEKEFAEKGLASRFVQINNSLSSHRGTLRGMHYQLPPFGEVKLVRCVRGSVYDVIVDLRPKSATYLQWFGADLTAENRKMMYVPAGFAHGYLTTSEDAELLYLVSAFYAPEFERGLRHDDPAIGIKWPIEPQIISEKDKLHRDFSPDYHLNSELKDLKV